MEIVKGIGTIIGVILSFITLLTLFCKPLRKRIGNSIRKAADTEQTGERLDELRAMMQQVMASGEERRQAIEQFRESQLSLLRDSITRLYFKYLPDKQVPSYERKDMTELFSSYEKLGGNSYVKTIYEEFMEWEVKA